MKVKLSAVSQLLKSKSNGYYYKISFITIPDDEYCYSYINPDNHNFTKWVSVIDAPKGSYIDNLEWKNKLKGIINADSKPKILDIGNIDNIKQLSLL